MKKYFIPDTDIQFKIGDVVELFDTFDDKHNIFGVITEINDTPMELRDYYWLRLNDSKLYERSSNVKTWYRKNRKGILVPYCDDELIDKIWYEKHKNDPPDPRIEEIRKSFEKIADKIYSQTQEEWKKTNPDKLLQSKTIKIAKFECEGLPEYKPNRPVPKGKTLHFITSTEELDKVLSESTKKRKKK